MKNGARATVLVVDDDPAVLGSVGFLLRAEGYDVQTHASVTALLEHRAPSGRVCVLLDLRMPEMDGVEVARQLQEHGRQWPVVLMTGDLEPPDAEAVRRAGLFSLLEKPFSDEQLTESVAGALANAPVTQAAGNEMADDRPPRSRRG